MAVEKGAETAGGTAGEIPVGSHRVGLRPEELKAGGLIPQRQKKTVTVRCMAPGGRVTSARLRRIADVAEKYGQGLVHLSVRMSPEILYVRLEDVEKVAAELAGVGQRIASCGKRVRVPTACGGCEYNPNGLTDTQRLAGEVNERYFGLDQHHKFKISFAGCPIDCVRAREMDLGFQGQVEPELIEEKCTGCELCVRACRDGALEMVEGFPERDPSRCTSCGDCIKACPFEAMAAGHTGHAVYVGGKHGKHPLAAYPVAELVPDEKVFELIEAVLAWYQAHGQRGERVGDAIARAGIDSLRRALRPVIGEYLLTRRDLEQPRWVKLFWPGAAGAFQPYGELDQGVTDCREVKGNGA